MRNKLTDLHNHLFEQLERLNDDDLQDEKLMDEIRRADAMCKVTGQIISNGRLMLDSLKAKKDLGMGDLRPMPAMLSE